MASDLEWQADARMPCTPSIVTDHNKRLLMKDNYHPLYRPDIDGLRAMAIISVVVFHVFPEWLPGGFVGVDIFFAISGFLISSIIFRSLDRGGFSFRSFYSHRVRRLFPALILVMGSCMLYGWFRLMPSEYKQLGRHVIAGMGFFQNLRLRGEAGYFDASSELKPLLHLWSLSIEEQFYLVFPAFIWLAWKVRFNVFMLVILLTLASFIVNSHAMSTDVVGAFFLPHMRFWELMAGSLLAYSTLDRDASPKDSGVRRQRFEKRTKWIPLTAMTDTTFANLNSLAGFLLIIQPLSFYDRGMAFPGWSAVPPILGSLLIIKAGLSAWVNKNLLGSRVLVTIGLISYPLYLWHWPVLAFMKMELGQQIRAELRFIVILVSLVLAWLTYWHIERPIKGFARRADITQMLVVMGSAIVAMGVLVTSHKGLNSRFPNLLPDLKMDRQGYPIEWRGGVCGLDRWQDFSAFADECFGSKANGSKDAIPLKTLLLWGDSYAAHLYPGLKAVLSDSYSITQLTTAGCPPVIGYVNRERPNCKSLNDAILGYLRTTPYDVVLLAGNWHYSNLTDLSASIDAIKSAGAGDIMLMGPPPQWIDGLPRTLFRHYLRAPNLPLPERLDEGLSMGTLELDAAMSEMSRVKGLRYLSALQAFCNPEGCKTLVGDAIVSFDMGHLSVAGSKYLASAIRDRLLPIHMPGTGL